MPAFASAASVNLTSTTSSQSTTIPAGSYSITVYNAGANTVWLKFASSVAVPSTGTWTAGVWAVQPGTTQSFDCPQTGSPLAYIAETAGGQLVVSVGSGE